MIIDNSAMLAFHTCPLKYYESYEANEGKGRSLPKTYLEFGKRWHQLLEHHYLQREVSPSTIPEEDELVCQSMFEAYKAQYPVEPFEVVDCEKVFKIPFCSAGHEYTGKIDMLVRDLTTKRLSIFETKTEKRNSWRNHPKAWAARTQASLYLWAAGVVYKETVDNIILNVCTKPSDKGRVPASFRRDILERTPKQIEEALEILNWTANAIDDLRFSHGNSHTWPAFRNACMDGNFPCDYYDLHNIGESVEMLKVFQPRDNYIEL